MKIRHKARDRICLFQLSGCRQASPKTTLLGCISARAALAENVPAGCDPDSTQSQSQSLGNSQPMQHATCAFYHGEASTTQRGGEHLDCRVKWKPSFKRFVSICQCLPNAMLAPSTDTQRKSIFFRNHDEPGPRTHTSVRSVLLRPSLCTLTDPPSPLSPGYPIPTNASKEKKEQKKSTHPVCSGRAPNDRVLSYSRLVKLGRNNDRVTVSSCEWRHNSVLRGTAAGLEFLAWVVLVSLQALAMLSRQHLRGHC